MDDDGKVISIGKDGHDPQFKLIKAPTSLCRHYSLEIDEFNRNVNCAICGKAIDPFDWLAKIAAEDIAMRQTIKWRKSEEKRIFDRVEELKKEERRVKARIRRAEVKSDE